MAEDSSILLEAQRAVDGARQKDYGHPISNYMRLAKMMSAILGIEVTPTQATLCMVAVKVSRLVESPGHRDSAVDLAGYALVHRMVVEEQARRATQ